MQIEKLLEKKENRSNNNFFINNFFSKKNKGRSNETILTNDQVNLVNGKFHISNLQENQFISEMNVVAIAKNFASLIKEQQLENVTIFIGTDNVNINKVYANIAARVLSENNFNVEILSKNNLPFNLNFICNSKWDFKIIFNVSELDAQFSQIHFLDVNDLDIKRVWLMKLFAAVRNINNFANQIPKSEAKLNISNVDSDYKTKMITKFKNLNIGKTKISINFANVNNLNFYQNLLNESNLNYELINYKNKTINNAAESKFFKKQQLKSMFKHYDLNFLIDTYGQGINVAAKNKSIYKFFKTDEIAALYLNYLLESGQLNKINKNKIFVAKSILCGSLTEEIAFANQIKVLNFLDYDEVIKKEIAEKKRAIFTYDEKNRFTTLNGDKHDFDALNFLIELLKMYDFYKQNQLTLFEALNKINKKYSKYFYTLKTYDFNDENAFKFLQRISSQNTLGKYKIQRIQHFVSDKLNSQEIVIQLNLEQNIKVLLKYSKTLSQIEIMCETVGPVDDLNQLIINENNVINAILELKEDYKNKKFSFWNIFKYLTFIGLFIGIFVFLFYSVYNVKTEAVSNPNIGQIFNLIWQTITYNTAAKWSFILLVASFLITILFNSLILKRLLQIQKEKVNFGHIILANIVGVVAQNITPKAIGGDIATYWFLRRQGINRSKLISAIIVNTFMWQIVNIILVVFFVPIGIYYYQEILTDFTNRKTIIFLIMLILGLTIDTIAATFFLVLTMSKKIQDGFLNGITWFLEWLPFVFIYNPEAKKAKYIYEFYQIRQGLKTCFKNVFSFIEILFYKGVVWVLAPITFVAKSANIVQSDLQGGWYFNILISTLLIKSANSISPTPGGIGTNDFISQYIFKSVFKANPEIGLNKAAESSSILTAISTIATVVIPTIIGLIFLIIVFIGEKRIDAHKQKRKIESLIRNDNSLETQKIKTRFYPISITFASVFLIGLTLWFLI
ncbi:lysylphosphatidylglycerol synthase transmembrane domain-containing protein [Mycoplasmopsis gallinarum]